MAKRLTSDELRDLINLNFKAIKAQNQAEFDVLHSTNKQIIDHQKETNGQIQQSKIDIELIKKDNENFNGKQTETDKELIRIERILTKSYTSVSFFRLLQRRPLYSVLFFFTVIIIVAKASNLFTFEQFFNAILTVLKTIFT